MPDPGSSSRLLLTLALGAILVAGCAKEDSAGLVTAARASLAEGDVKAAMIQLKNAIAADSKNAEARFELGQVYLEQGNLAGAEKEFRRAREAGYPSTRANPMIARAMLGQRAYQRVLDELPASPEADADADADAATLLALRATAELALGKLTEAGQTLGRAQQIAPDAVDVRLAEAQMALAARDVPGALHALEAALRTNPTHRDTLLLKGDILRATGKPTEAEAVYRSVIKADPRQVNARLALAGMALAKADLAAARSEVNAALKAQPDNLQARYTEALIDFREKKTEQARDHLAAVLRAAPDYVPALLLGGSIEYELGNLQTAETHLNKVIKAAPTNVYALRLLAATQLRLGRTEDAARTLAPALASERPDAGVLMVAGEIALARRDYAGASNYFEQAATRNPDSAIIRTELGISRLAQGDARAMADLQTAAGMEGGTSRADHFIILNQLKTKDYDAVLTSVAALEKKLGTSPLTLNYRAAAYLGKKDTPRARDAFAQALKMDPGFFPAAANLAQLDLKDKQPAAARQRFEAILKVDPKHLNAMLALADLALLSNDEKSYVNWLEKASSAHPEALQPRLALARYQLARGDKNKALATAREAVNAQSDNPAALDLLGTVQLALGDTTNALASYRKLVDQQPGRAAPMVKLATVQIVAKDLDAARKTLQDALRAEPGSVDAALMLGGIDIKAGRFNDARALAKQVQRDAPKLSAGHILEGDAAYARKDMPAALAAYERAQALDASSAALIRQLAVLTATQQAEAGEKKLETWLATHPDDATARAVLAESLIKRGHYAAAAEHYLRLNAGSPNNLLILNNLAWSLHEAKDPRALQFAEQALKLKPDNPSVMDTLGWILVRSGNASRGLTLLRQAQSKAPDDPEIQFHLAAALAQTGDTRRAIAELQRLLGAGTPFAAGNEARALLKRLQTDAR